MILNIQPPCNVKEVGSFIRAVTYYHDMFAHPLHILTPLTKKEKAEGKIHMDPYQKSLDE